MVWISSEDFQLWLTSLSRDGTFYPPDRECNTILNHVSHRTIHSRRHDSAKTGQDRMVMPDYGQCARDNETLALVCWTLALLIPAG
jgi:hypothetical protein